MCSSGPDPQPMEGAGSLHRLEGVLIRLAAVGSPAALPGVIVSVNGLECEKKTCSPLERAH